MNSFDRDRRPLFIVAIDKVERGNPKLNVMRSDDGIDWGTKVRLDQESDKSPTLGTLNDGVLISWIGLRDRKINVGLSDSGVDF